MPDTILRLDGENVVKIADMGRKYRDVGISDCSDCPLCRALVEYYTDSEGPDYDKLREHGSDILCAALLVPKDRPTYLPTNSAAHNLAVLVLLPKGADERPSWNRIQWKLAYSGYLVCQRHGYGTQPLKMQPRTQPHVNMNIIGPWLDHCHQLHKKCAKPEPPPFSLTLIDCQTWRLINSEPSVSYIALSYVWGGLAVEPPRDDKLPAGIPAVIRDAIDMTRVLGYRYLWVDAYCINQEDSILKHAQIQLMGSIYRGAEVTLVDAAGPDSAFGLAGSVQTPRVLPRQEILSVGGYKIAPHPRDVVADIMFSPWSQRAWTYQEGLLSRRLIVFYRDQAYFECTRHCGSESLGSCDDNHDVGGFFVKQRELHNGPFIRSIERSKDSATFEKQFDNYMDRVLYYSSRSLTYDEDSLNAFSAIINEYKDMELHVKNGLVGRFSVLTGIPFLSANTGYDDTGLCRHLIFGLLWYHNTFTRRRHGLPSWSWAGWEGGVQSLDYSLMRDHYGRDFMWYEPLFENVQAEETSYGADGAISINRASIFKEHNLQTPQILMFDAIALPPSSITLELEDGVAQWYIYQRPAIAVISRKIPLFPTALLRGFMEEGCYRVLLMAHGYPRSPKSYCEELAHEFLLLVVRKMTSTEGCCYYERVGIFMADNCNGKWALSVSQGDGPLSFWKVVEELRRTCAMETWALL